MSHKLTIMPSRHSVTIMEGETLLGAALREGHTLLYGCRKNRCGECLEVDPVCVYACATRAC